MALKLIHRVYIFAGLICTLAIILVAYLLPWEPTYKVVFAGFIYAIGAALTHLMFKDVDAGLEALKIGLLNLKDGEFSSTLAHNSEDELGYMCQLYNQTVEQMMHEKRWLYQRELLLDKITQSSPEALFLVDHNQQVVFSNIAARRFFNIQHGLEGSNLTELLIDAPSGLQSAIEIAKDGLFSIDVQVNKLGSENQTWHMSTGNFVLNNQKHKLYILKQMTRELSRQEVAVWKKVIRVISHELNNSLGPISSMLHSGRILSLNVKEDRLARVFSTIDERIKHLSEFVQGYGRFAKIPEPKIEKLSSLTLLQSLSEQWRFKYDTEQDLELYADPSQLEQLLINLIKNAHESGSPLEQIELQISINKSKQESQILVIDAGKGVASASLNSVLIPFYSTKANGSGLGLALCREIVEAHHGNISINNRESGGLIVRVTLPLFSKLGN
jgi:nitrogen fixation/metabolism regulation signal transduction histidine kinase